MNGAAPKMLHKIFIKAPLCSGVNGALTECGYGFYYLPVSLVYYYCFYVKCFVVMQTSINILLKRTYTQS